MHRAGPNDDLLPIRPLPTIPVETASKSRSSQFDFGDRGATERRRHPPEDLFGMRGTEHVALPVQRNNLYIAVAAFVFMLLLGLFAAFFRLRLQLEHHDWNDMRLRAPATRMDSVPPH
jgi:hypothetical protein